MGRKPKGEAAMVPLNMRVAAGAKEWLDGAAAEVGMPPAELARILLSKGAAAWRSGWRPGR